MKRMFAVFVAVLGFGVAYAADTHESLAEESIKLMDKLAVRLKDVTDKPSGEKTMEKIKELSKEMQDTRRKAMALPRVEGDAKRTMEAKFKPKMDEAGGALKKELKRIAEDVPGGKDYVKEVTRLLAEATKEAKEKK